MGVDDLPDKGGLSEGYKVVRTAKENVEVDLGTRQCSAVFVKNSDNGSFLWKRCFP